MIIANNGVQEVGAKENVTNTNTIEIEINGRLYSCTVDESGEVTSMRRFNDKHKTWVTLNFGLDKDKGNIIDKKIIQTLTAEYLDSFK
ncbi:hypothetical protein [Paenibacillus pinihumi]|uniref:hypothetical protein n=1 Tax=Paenibacillus pinihumi TaxID=669462 RepID=UPI00048CAD90|nr:hypothetical protein [Paenibacillus pinihumi]